MRCRGGTGRQRSSPDADCDRTRCSAYGCAMSNGMHALRHFYASALIDVGESASAVAEYLGLARPARVRRPSTECRLPSAPPDRFSTTTSRTPPASKCATSCWPATASGGRQTRSMPRGSLRSTSSMNGPQRSTATSSAIQQPISTSVGGRRPSRRRSTQGTPHIVPHYRLTEPSASAVKQIGGPALTAQRRPERAADPHTCRSAALRLRCRSKDGTRRDGGGAEWRRPRPHACR